MSLIRALSIVVLAATLVLLAKSYFAKPDPLVEDFKTCRVGIPNQSTIRACNEVLKQPSLPNKVRSSLLRSRASAYLEARDNDRALADANEAVLLAPDSDRAYWVRAQIHLKLGDFDSAELDYEQALSVSSAGFAYSAWWINEMKKQGKHEQALTACEQLVLSDPANTVGHSCRIKSLLRLGRTVEAVDLLKQLAETGSDKDKVGAYFLLGRVYLHLDFGKVQTLAAFEKLSALGGEEAKPLSALFLAATHYKFGEQKAGRSYIDEVAQHMARDLIEHPVGAWKAMKTILVRTMYRDAAVVHFSGIAYSMIEEYELARQEFDRFMEMGGPNARALMINAMVERGFAPSEKVAQQDQRVFDRGLERYMVHYGRHFSLEALLD